MIKSHPVHIFHYTNIIHTSSPWTDKLYVMSLTYLPSGNVSLKYKNILLICKSYFTNKVKKFGDTTKQDSVNLS